MADFPLHRAAKDGNIPAARNAYERGVNIDGYNASGQTPLHVAIDYEQLAMVRFLIDHCRANVNLVEHNGWTPLRCARYHRRQYVEICNFLIQRQDHQ